MATIAHGTATPARTEATPAYQAYKMLQVGYVVLPIVAGLDKFAFWLVDWHYYLAPVVARNVGYGFMSIVGAVEILAGVLVAVRPQVGAAVVGLWLLAIVGNLLLIPGYYDIALRDFGLAIGAFALARLATAYEGK